MNNLDVPEKPKNTRFHRFSRTTSRVLLITTGHLTGIYLFHLYQDPLALVFPGFSLLMLISCFVFKDKDTRNWLGLPWLITILTIVFFFITSVIR